MEAQATVRIGRPLPGGLDGHKADLDFVMDFIEKSNEHRSDFIRGAQEVLDNYMVRPLGGAFFHQRHYGAPQRIQVVTPMSSTGRLTLKDNETHVNIENLSAQALLLLFGAREYIEATPIGADDYEKARQAGRLIQAVCDGEGKYRTFYQAWKDSWIFGTAILEFGWERRMAQEVAPVYVMDENGEPDVQYTVQNVVSKEGPLIRQTDFFDFYPDPSGTRIQHDMLCVAKRFRITKGEAMALARAGVYDGRAVVKAIGNDRERGAAQKKAGPVEERFWEIPKNVPDAYGVMVGFELWGRVPFRTPDGLIDRVVTIVSGEVVRSTIIPHAKRTIPFKEIVVNPITGRFYGLGPAEVNRFMQDSADHKMNSLTEIVNYLIRQPLLVGMGWQGDPDQLRRRAYDDIIPCMNPEMVKPIPTDFRGAEIAAAELARLKQSMREGSGDVASAQQLASIDRAVATQVAEISRMATQRTELQVMMSEREDFKWIGNHLLRMLKQFGPDDGFLASLNGQPLDVPLEAIDAVRDVRFTGSRQAEGKFQKFRKYAEIVSTAANALPLIPIMPEVFVRMFRDGADVEDAEAILSRAVERFQDQQLRDAVLGAAQRPQQGAGQRSQQALTPAGAAQEEGQLVA